MGLYNRTEKSIIKNFVNNPKVDVESVLAESSRLIYEQCVQLMQDNGIKTIKRKNDDIYDDMEYGLCVDCEDDAMHYAYIKKIQLAKPYKDRDAIVKVTGLNIQDDEEYDVNRYDINGHIYNVLSVRQCILDHIENTKQNNGNNDE